MFIPPNNLKNKFAPTQRASQPVRLKSDHLLIDRAVAQKVFGDDLNVNVVYYADRNILMIAPKSDELFKQLHKTKQHMLKDRNEQGDKTIALHELLIDNEIDRTDKALAYEYEEALKILTVKL